MSKRLPEMLHRWNRFEAELKTILSLGKDESEQLYLIGLAIDEVTGRAPFHFAKCDLGKQEPFQPLTTYQEVLANKIKAILNLG